MQKGPSKAPSLPQERWGRPEPQKKDRPGGRPPFSVPQRNVSKTCICALQPMLEEVTLFIRIIGRKRKPCQSTNSGRPARQGFLQTVSTLTFGGFPCTINLGVFAPAQGKRRTQRLKDFMYFKLEALGLPVHRREPGNPRRRNVGAVWERCRKRKCRFPPPLKGPKNARLIMPAQKARFSCVQVRQRGASRD